MGEFITYLPTSYDSKFK